MSGTRGNTGFTLLELLIVIAIIGILAAVLVPRLLGSRQLALDRSAQLYARNVFEAGMAYASEEAGRLVITGNCLTSYTAGGYEVNSPGTNAILTCVVTDTNSDGLPEVKVVTPKGRVYQYD